MLSAVNRVTIGQAPRTTRNSETKPFKPGRPSEDIELKISKPPKTGTSGKSPPQGPRSRGGRRGDAQHHKAHVVDRGISHQSLEIRLPVGRQCAENDGGGGQ